MMKMNKIKKEKNMKKNVWFLVAGIISIIESVSCALATLIFVSLIGRVGDLPFYDEMGNPLAGEALELAQSTMRTLLITCIVMMVIVLAFSIFQAVVYMKSSKLSHEELKKGLVITAIVFSFLSGGILTGVFGLLGYNEKISQVQVSNTIDVTNVSTSNDGYEKVKEDLQNLENLKKSGIISEEEYAQKRKDIIDKM